MLLLPIHVALFFLSFICPLEDNPLESGEQALLKGDLEQAVLHFKEAARGENREKGLFRWANALISANRLEEAIEPIDCLIREFREGPYHHKARFQKAMVLKAQKRFPEALAIYEEEVSGLLSTKRKQEIAQHYIQYAKELENPEQEGGPRHKEAVKLYHLVLDLEPPESLDESVRFKIVGLYELMGDKTNETKSLLALKERHPKSSGLDEADFRLAEILLHKNKPQNARSGFRAFLKQHPRSKKWPDALYGLALTYGIPEPGNKNDLTLGIKALNDFIQAAPDHKLAPKAFYEIGCAYYYQKQYEDAAHSFEAFIKKYEDLPDTQFLPNARFSLGGAFSMQKRFSKGLAIMKDFLIQHPSHSLWDSAQRMILDMEYSWCQDLIKKKQYEKAEELLLSFCLKHPLDSRTPKAYFLLGTIKKQQENYTGAIAAWRRLASKYPASDQGSQAQFNVGLLYETKLKDFKAAFKAYQKVKGSYQGEALSRMELMRKKSLRLSVEKRFRSNQTPKVRVLTRNNPELSFKAYNVDLRDFFLKQKGKIRIEDLDIDLIKPDFEWKSKVKNYLKYGEMDYEEELPFKKPGAYVVSVSNNEIEGSVLVLITDLDIIVKSGRRDLLVFAQNSKDQCPMENVEVMVCEKGKVLFTGKTGEHGVFLKAHESLKNAKVVDVFAAFDSHCATNALNIQTLVLAKGLTSKAYLFTDRSVYTPGASIRLKGFIREADQGAYYVDQEKRYQLLVSGPSGVQIHKKEIKMNRFGGFDAQVNLHQKAPTGYYTFKLSAPTGWTESLRVQVLKYASPTAIVAINLSKKVYYPGEKVKGRIKAQYAYGAPVRQKKIRISTKQGFVMEGETDHKGEIGFEMDTKDFGASNAIVLSASLPSENASATHLFFYSTTGFKLNTRTSRPVVLLGETLGVEIEAKRPNGDPCETSGELRVLFLEDSHGIKAEREIQRIPFQINSQEKKAVVNVSFDRGGDYRFRAVAKDSFSNLIASDCMAFISGKKDKVKLRIFADEVTYDAGQSANIRVHSRCEPSLALLTCEGERIFWRQVVRLKPGDNPIPLLITPSLAPNFTFSAALMEDQKLHLSQTDLKVRSDLKVLVEPLAKEIGPGQEVKIKLSVQDRTGKPVEGEFAMALVDAALLAKFPNTLPPIQDFFFERERKGRMLTQSSCTFAYKAQINEIDRSILEEARRRVLLATAQEPQDEEVIEEIFEEEAEMVLEDAEALPQELRKKLKSLGYTGKAEGARINDVIGIGGGAGGRFGGKWRKRSSVRHKFLETAFWNPKVITNASGQALVSVTAPHNITTWKILVRGLTKDTASGSGQADLRVKKDLIAALEGPCRLVENDRCVYTARVSNGSPKDLKVKVTFEAEQEQEKEILIQANSTQWVDFPAQFKVPGPVTLKLSARAGPIGDIVKQEIQVLPYGMPVSQVKSGAASSDREVRIHLPEDPDHRWRKMEIRISPSISDAFFFLGMKKNHRFSTDLCQSLTTSLHTLDFMRRTGKTPAPGLMASIEQGVADLLLQQKPSGAFSWINRKSESVFASCEALKALALAHRMGFYTPEKHRVKVLNRVKNKMRVLEDKEKILCLTAISFEEPPDFTTLNRLFRSRNFLEMDELAPLALCCYMGGYEDQAKTLIKLFTKPGQNPRTAAHMAWALSLGDPSNPLLKETVNQLFSPILNRKCDSAIAGALCEYLASASLESTNFELKVFVNNREIKTLKVSGPSPVEILHIPPENLVAKENRVQFKFNGRGEYAYNIRLTAFTPNPPAPTEQDSARVRRTHIQQPITYRGEKAAEYDKGWSTVLFPKEEKKFINKISSLKKEEICLVELRSECMTEDHKITDTLPAGAAVIPSGIKGNHCYFEIQDQTITFYFQTRKGKVTYPMFAANQGAYQTLPAILETVVDQKTLAYGESIPPFEILPENAESKPYRMRPDELYKIGINCFENKELDRAKKLLSQFISRFTPKHTALVKSANILFKIAFLENNNKDLITYFELLRDRDPDLYLTFLETARTAAAYREMGESEQALALLGMIADASFGRESKVAEALEDKKACDYLKGLILAYPDLPLVQSSLFALGQQAVKIANKTKKQTSLKEAESLIREFLITYPNNPLCDQAGYSLVSFLLDMENSTEAARLCPLFLKRWPQSKLKSSLEYALAYALFETNRYDDAKSMLIRVADKPFSGLSPLERDDQDLARYILGQIEHGKGMIKEALFRYSQVKSKFEDAREVIQYFTEKTLILPEFAKFQSGQPPVFELKYKNIPEIKLSVYKVDLMKLYLARKSLNSMAKVNLAGIRPILSKTVALGDGADYVVKTRKLDASLTEKGAYLLVAQGEGLNVSGMVLISDLTLDVQEEASSGRIRVNAKNARTGAFLKGAHVKAIGSNNQEFLSGATDLRGVCVLENVSGLSAVIAELDDEYAFFRGKTMLQPPRTKKVQRAYKRSGQARERALRNVFGNYYDIQESGAQMMDDLIQGSDKGVQIK